jgi:hypothetical protein
MKNLDSRARAIVEAARNADPPTSDDRDRIRRGIAMQVAAGAALVSTAAVAGTMSFATKVGLVVATAALVGGGSVGAVKVWHAHQGRHVAVEAPRARAEAAKPAPAGPKKVLDLPAPPPAKESADTRTGRSERVRGRSPSVAPETERPSLDDPLNAEVSLLVRAREELRHGKPARALDTLAEYDRRFGRGVLGEERRAIAAIATCEATPGPQARAQAEAFIRSAPSSPLLDRVRTTCIKPLGPGGP